MRCPECSGEVVLIEQTGGMAHSRCVNCGRDFFSLPTPMPGKERRARVVVKWKNELLSFSELEGLRKISPAAREISASEIWRSSKDAGWVLGEYALSEAYEIQRQARALGLSAECMLVGEAEGEIRPSRLIVRWKSTMPSIDEIAALRKLSDEAANMSLSEVMSRARKGDWVLGEFWPNRASEIESRARALGLTVRREEGTPGRARD